MNHRVGRNPSAPALRLRSLRPALAGSGQAGQARFLLVLVSITFFFLFNSARAREICPRHTGSPSRQFRLLADLGDVLKAPHGIDGLQLLWGLRSEYNGRAGR